jgi:uncharacterized OB-fold protein
MIVTFAYLYLTKFQTDAVALVALTEAKALIICFIGRDKIDQLKIGDCVHLEPTHKELYLYSAFIGFASLDVQP